MVWVFLDHFTVVKNINLIWYLNNDVKVLDHCIFNCIFMKNTSNNLTSMYLLRKFTVVKFPLQCNAFDFEKPTRLWKCVFLKNFYDLLFNVMTEFIFRMQFVMCLPLYTQKSWAMGELQGQNYNRNGSFSELYVGIHNGSEIFMKFVLKI